MWESLYLIHLDPWILYVNIAYLHFKQFLHYKISRFIFVLQTIVIKLPTLKHLLISPFALLPLCVFQISSQMMAMSNFGNILITLGLEAINMLLKIWLFFKIFLTMSNVKEVFVFSMR